MTKEEFVKGLKFLSIAYNKEFDKEKAEVWYSMLEEYNYETYKNALKEIVKTNKFLPSVSEIIEYCNKTIQNKTLDIIENMKNNGYFKTEYEYEKILNWFNEGIIPNWFKEDMKKYNLKQLENNQVLLLN